jgi:hypothetical protein
VHPIRETTAIGFWKNRISATETILMRCDLQLAMEVMRAVMLKPKEWYEAAEKPEMHSERM